MSFEKLNNTNNQWWFWIYASTCIRNSNVWYIETRLLFSTHDMDMNESSVLFEMTHKGPTRGDLLTLHTQLQAFKVWSDIVWDIS